jgi:hypothetical protein
MMTLDLESMRVLNSIASRQNEPGMLELLRAKTNRYDLAQRLFRYEALVAAISVAAFLIATNDPSLNPFAALIGIVGIIVAHFLVEGQRAATVQGAAVQEKFDVELLGLEARRTPAEERISPEDIYIWSADYSGKRQLMDWYAPEVQALPIEIARIACQRANGEWDATMRNRFAGASSKTLIGLLAIPLVLAVVNNEGARNLVQRLFAAAPFLYLCVNTIRVNARLAHEREGIQYRAQRLWEDAIYARRPIEELAWESRALQDDIYALRQVCAPVFDWAYSRYRTLQESSMRRTAKELVAEYERLENGLIRSRRSPCR